LVTLSSNRGGIVSELSLSEIKELFELRAVLETWLLSHALPVMTEADLQKAEMAANKMLVGEVANWGDLNRKFHETLYAPAGREQTMLLLRRIHHNIDRYLRIQITQTSGWEKAQEEHQKLVNLCRTKDVRRAMAALETHIMEAADELTDMISKHRDARRVSVTG
jgi:DNA-binding GntR family transcriptional regulator